MPSLSTIVSKPATHASDLPLILIAIDDPAVTFPLQKMLSDIGELFILENGDDALATVRRLKPDLLLLDGEMAGASGLDICAAVKSDPDHEGLPVIFVTALGDSASEVQALAAGAVDIITKPFNSSIVMARVNTHLALKQRNDELLRHIRKRKNIQEELHDKHNLLADLTAQVPGMLFQYRLYPDGRASCPFVSESVRKILGLAPEELQKDASLCLAFIHPEDMAVFLESIEESARTLQPWKHDYRYALPDESIVWAAGEAIPVKLDDDSILWHGYIRNVTDLMQAETDRNRLSEQLQLVLNAARLGWWHHDPVSQMATFDDRYREIFGFAENQLPIADIVSRLHPEDRPGLLAKIIASQDPIDPKPYENEYRIILPDSSIRWVEARGMATFDGKDTLRRAVSVSGTVADITERKQAEQRIQRLTRLYAALSHCNQVIVRANNEQELFQEICQVSVMHGGMKMAWIGLLDQATMQVRPVASCGICPDYLENMRVSIEACFPIEQDLFGTVIRENRPVWCREYINSDFSIPAKERAIKYGWIGLAVLPIHRNGITIGTFALYTGDADAFDEAAQNLLLEIVRDVDFALDNFDRTAERDMAIQALRESEASYSALFCSNTVVMLLLDPADGRIINANERAQHYYGYEIETLKCMNIRDINVSSNDQIETALKRALDGKNRFLFQHRLASGELRDVEVFSGPVVIKGRDMLLSSIHDVTERSKVRRELESSRERLAELSSQLIHTQEQEKKNLARELHDELGQRFTSLNITMHHLRNQICCNHALETWQKAADDVAALIQRVRDISHSLRPSMLDYLGLGVTVEHLLAEHFFHSSIKYVFEYAGLPDKLPSQIEITAYRIVQEAITNVVRHSKATQVVVELNGGEEAQELEIVVRDNGTGFDLDAARQRMSRSGIGVMGMRERVKLLGGEFTLKTTLGDGTRIDVTLPLK